ncbi:hypothetical protein LZ32DRAFT_651192 [Colletotrichum eremochloae]|nr:hypothetical protein LZ32DRAFT_651192 [Colletotrichum eremochloae]
MGPNATARASDKAVNGRTSAGDPFMKIPVELHKAILDDLDDRRDVYAISQASPVMNKTARGIHGIVEQLLRTELGQAQLRTLIPDALAVVMFPPTIRTLSDTGKKAMIVKHFWDWKSNHFRHHVSYAAKTAAYVFIDRFAIPFAEDFAALTGTIHNVGNQIRLPEWAHHRRSRKATLPATGIWRYGPEERVRLLRAFCRFELLSKVIRARPGAQLHDFDEPIDLLKLCFKAWEVEEILCVQLYVGDMYTILFETHVTKVFRTMLNISINPRLIDHSPGGQYVRLRRGPFEDYVEIDDDKETYQNDEFHTESAGSSRLTTELLDSIHPYSPTQEDSDDSDANSESSSKVHGNEHHDETEWFTKTGTEPDPGTPCFKFELAGHEKHITFIRAHGHVILDGMADPAEAEYFGPIGERLMEDGGITRLSYRLFDLSQANDGSATLSSTQTNAYLAYGCGSGSHGDAAANTAWRHLDATNPQLREAFRRCGWVFWSDARLRRHVFWNRRLDVFSPDTAPSWLYRPEGRGPNIAIAAATPDECDDDKDDDENEFFLPIAQMSVDMVSAIAVFGLGPPPRIPGLRSAAEAKLVSFLAEHQVREGNVLFYEHPFDRFRHIRIPLALWEECMGGADTAVPPSTVQVFPGIFWG